MRWLLAPFVVLARLLVRPFAIARRRRAAGPSGWIELLLEGEIRELPAARATLVQRLMRAREDGPRVTLSALDRLAAQLAEDPRAKGVLVRLGPLSGGWASSMRVRAALERVRRANKRVRVHVTQLASNREYAVATAGESISAVPNAIFAAIGSASQTLFLGETLDRFGVKVEVASAGRYKSAPDSFTRRERSEPDREQARALVGAFDDALLGAIVEGRKLSLDEAKARVDAMPFIGARAVEERLIDETAHDEDLAERVQKLESLEEPPELIPAGDYLAARTLKPIIPRRERVIGVVEVHGTIVDRATPMLGALEGNAVEKSVVSDLRAALADKRVAAVVLHVVSRGGSVIASDAIWSAVRRVDREKPVIACFGDVSASGGYYVACGARAIVCSPLTVTGSIGVFGLMPTWPGITERLAIHPDAVAERKHAAMASPWRTHTDEERAHAQAEIMRMYRAFVGLVAEARKRPVEEIEAIAEGRVWIGKDAHARGLVDGLGGMDEAVERARALVKGRVAERPVVIRAKKPLPRPAPHKPEAIAALLGLPVVDPIVLEAIALWSSSPWAAGFVWAPVAQQTAPLAAQTRA